jgi:uncharacterized protein
VAWRCSGPAIFSRPAAPSDDGSPALGGRDDGPARLRGRGFGLRRPLWLLVAGPLALGGAAAAWLVGGKPRIDLVGVPVVQLPLPSVPAGARSVSEAPPSGPPATGPPPAVIPALIENGPFGPLPRIGPNGSRPFLAYARPFDLHDRRPRVALLIVGLGLQADLTDAAIALPGEISLEFSAYGADLPGWSQRARRAGHEVLLDLPMEPADYPASDPGPHTLLASDPDKQVLKRLDWLLARASGYVAVAGTGARFATNGRAATALEDLARRGLALVELGQADLAARASAVGLPYASAGAPLDLEPSTRSIDRALAGLEAEALRKGSALASVQAYPISLVRLRRWAASLGDKGLVLAPVSAVVIRQSAPAAEMRGEAERSGRAQD